MKKQRVNEKEMMTMKTKEKKSLNYYMRALHRDIGFLVVGITLVFCVSGILLIFRDTDLLKKERIIVRTLSPNMTSSDIGKALHMRNLKVIKEEGDVVYFENGTYDKVNGSTSFTSKELPSFLSKLNTIHKTPSSNFMHWFTLLYGVALLFLAVSSFWMYKVKTKMFTRGIVFAAVGFVIAAIIIFISF
jgi:hypothetical protein